MSKEEGLIDLLIPELLKRAELAQAAGFDVFFKFTCEQCGARLTFEEANTFYTSGTCDKCGHITQIKQGGFMVIKNPWLKERLKQ